MNLSPFQPRLAVALAVIAALAACTSSSPANTPIQTATPGLADLPFVSPTEPLVEAVPATEPPAATPATVETAAAVEPPAATPATAETALAADLPTATAVTVETAPATNKPGTPASAESEPGFDLPEPPRSDPVDLIRRLKPEQYTAYLNRPEPDVAPVSEGDTATFNVIRDNGAVEISAVAERVSEHAYFYFDRRFPPSDNDVDRAVERFETEVWPSVTGLFGPVATPGVDGDPRIVLLHTTLGQGIGGYFSAADAFPKTVMVLSNERDMIYISASMQPGSDRYSGVLAHELQHAVNFAGDRGEEAWLNEGLSELAATRAGFPARSYQNYINAPDTQLTSWPNDGDPASSYGAGLLFSEYLIDQYGGGESISTLIADEANGFASIDSYLDAVGSDDTALEVFINWTVANLLKEEGTEYGYPNRDSSTLGRVPRRIAIDADEYRGTVNQFGADYWVVTVADDDTVRISFAGASTTRLIPTTAHSGSSCWWSNSGDTIDTTVTRRFDLTGVDTATLEFAVWYDIEELWDFAYVEVSIDGGETWLLLDGTGTTDENPNGTGYGPGLTGNSGGWIDESVDLSEFAGGEVLIRFEYVTDDAVYINGACFDDIAIPEIGFFDDAESASEPGEGWTANGFARVDPEIPQEWSVTLVRRRTGAPTIVTPIDIVDGRGEAIIDPIPRDEDVFLVVSATSLVSITPADYTLNFEVAGRPGT